MAEMGENKMVTQMVRQTQDWESLFSSWYVCKAAATMILFLSHGLLRSYEPRKEERVHSVLCKDRDDNLCCTFMVAHKYWKVPIVPWMGSTFWSANIYFFISCRKCLKVLGPFIKWCIAPPACWVLQCHLEWAMAQIVHLWRVFWREKKKRPGD